MLSASWPMALGTLPVYCACALGLFSILNVADANRASHRNGRQTQPWSSALAHAPETATPDRKGLMCYLKRELQTMDVVREVSDPSSSTYFKSGLADVLQGSCAVVSGSATHRHKLNGGRIDHYKAVIRFNGAPVDGYVGFRDSVRLVNSGFVQSVLRGGSKIKEGVIYVCVRPNMTALQDVIARWPRVRFYVLDENFASTVGNITLQWFRLGHPNSFGEVSLSTLGMFLAMKLCDSVQAYEMTPVAITAPSNDHHAKSNDGTDSNTLHSIWQAEDNLWTRLSLTPVHQISATGTAQLPGFGTVDCSLVGGVAQLALIMQHQRDTNTRQGRPPLAITGMHGHTWHGIALAVSLVALLPVAMAYTAQLWNKMRRSGQLSSQMKRMDVKQVLATSSLTLYVTLLITSDTLASYTAQMHGGRYPWEPASVVLLVEAVKFLVSLFLFSTMGSRVDEERGKMR